MILVISKCVTGFISANCFFFESAEAKLFASLNMLEHKPDQLYRLPRARWLKVVTDIPSVLVKASSFKVVGQL